MTPNELGVFKPLQGYAKPKKQWMANFINDATFIDYFNRLQELAINMYKWENLPDTVNERFLEYTLHQYGYAVFFEDEVIGYLALTAALGGPLDVYRIPIYRRAYAANNYQKELDNKDSIIIYNNYLHIPTFSTLILFARRLYEIERTIEINVKAQKTPVLLSCEESQELTMRNIYAQYDGNQPVILKYKNADISPLEVMKTDAPFVGNDLQVLKKQIWQEALSFLGIRSANTEKKERLITPEVENNVGNVEASRFVMLNARREAADKINRMFGLNIKVNFRGDEINETSGEGGAVDGTIHDRTGNLDA